MGWSTSKEHPRRAPKHSCVKNTQGVRLNTHVEKMQTRASSMGARAERRVLSRVMQRLHGGGFGVRGSMQVHTHHAHLHCSE
jgi:hypothetical protein